MNWIATKIKNRVGFITLNSEKTLNSLSLPMIEELQTVLTDWKTSDEIVCIFLQGAGEKAFCAGGDVRKLYDAIIDQRNIDHTKVPKDCYDFFSKEYQVDFDIHTYPKPVIVWGHGIVMGGGIGLMVGASHRIVTEKSKLAMPEITIGLYPDVGGTWFLNKMPSAYGIYLGLTGARLDGADCLFLGLADYYVESSSKQNIINALEQTSWKGDPYKIVSGILNSASEDHTVPESQAAGHQYFIRQFEGVESVEQFKNILTHHPDKDEWINNGIKSFEAGSPSSAHIIFRQLQQGRNLSLEEVFHSELNLSCQCCLHPDFAEGVRALLVDKDLSPKWNPATWDDITEEWIDSYFKLILKSGKLKEESEKL
ncbi:enoyl-CoA hydratase/isomerase family protein [Chryseobacterium lactis]|uniref:3-hydroxyisobutyryl-CoA hydrolase n=1 Tax=Chryseobacterium lactis TaxID=1241981 RepID=A0A3G6RRK5_CHRLC|nr:enoyl-CoA hydratase/isomerase family protein [Chryseobacterium lactis]AZA83715.1 enoyl-CoA hydratase/isomerase family protein [Chryseobacterium lactis]AZB04100.1 enoyl-CoA hydratase/isomerase family protein [Chryseobacterium lactis]PNW12992.1 enoyl-CoA hydratase/isomerase family protein [Chryseobacterium lactis]